MGDEDGRVWSWGVEDVSCPLFLHFEWRKRKRRSANECAGGLDEKGELIGSFKAHERAILWTLSHPKEKQLITAGADGNIKIWGAGQ